MDKRSSRIAHVLEHQSVDTSNAVQNLENGTGSRIGSAMRLSSNAMAHAICAWFVEQDLAKAKNWAYVSARLEKFCRMTECDTLGPVGKTLALLMPLLSDNESLINWFAENVNVYDAKRIDNIKTVDFWAYQSILALRGEMERLRARCEAVLSSATVINAQKKYLGDYRFFLALANGDLDGMESALKELLTPASLRARSNEESGFTDGLISTSGVIYAKIAYRHGYEVKVNSPFIPDAWLPVKPLDNYDECYSFLK